MQEAISSIPGLKVMEDSVEDIVFHSAQSQRVSGVRLGMFIMFCIVISSYALTLYVCTTHALISVFHLGNQHCFCGPSIVIKCTV